MTTATGEGDALHVTFAPKGRPVMCNPTWRSAHAYDRRDTHARGWLPGGVTPWDGPLQLHVSTGQYDALNDDPAAFAD